MRDYFAHCVAFPDELKANTVEAERVFCASVFKFKCFPVFDNRLNMEILQGQKFNTAVYMDAQSYLWLNRKTVAAKKYLRCYVKECPASCTVDGLAVVLLVGHNHDADLAYVDMLLFKARLRRLAATTTSWYKKIFSESQLIHEEGALLAGGYHQCLKIMKTARAQQWPSVPQTLQQLADALKIDT